MPGGSPLPSAAAALSVHEVLQESVTMQIKGMMAMTNSMKCAHAGLAADTLPEKALTHCPYVQQRIISHCAAQ